MKIKKKIKTRKDYITRLTISIILIFVTGSLLMMMCFYYFVPRFIFDGDYLTINVNDPIVDTKSIARYKGKLISYKIKNKIDTSEPGEYVVTYVINSGGKTYEEERKVIVVDSVSPVIHLKGNQELTINYKDKYIEPGFSVTDNYDTDLINNVDIKNSVNTEKIGEYTVIYTVKDSSGNINQAIRLVKVSDIEKPIISVGEYKKAVILGDEFIYPNVKAYDSFEGDLTEKIEKNGEVDTQKEGVYSLTYKVIDSNNNETIRVLKVNVQKKNTKGIPVLDYHYFYDDINKEKSKSNNYVAISDFENQMKYLIENNYYFPTFDELSDYIDGTALLPMKSIIITIDDASESFYKLAMPILERLGINYNVFVITNNDSWKEHKDKLVYANYYSHSDSLHKKSCNGGTSGAAVCSNYNKIYEDTKTSISKLNNKNVFSYPYGSSTTNYIKALKANNVTMAFTESSGLVKVSQNKYKLPRILVKKGVILKNFIKLIN